MSISSQGNIGTHVMNWLNAETVRNATSCAQCGAAIGKPCIDDKWPMNKGARCHMSRYKKCRAEMHARAIASNKLTTK